MKAQPAASGTKLGKYHWRQAVEIEGKELDLLLIGAVDIYDPAARAEAIERLSKLIERELRQEYDSLVDGLAVALMATGERDYLKAVERLRDIHELDFEGFEEAIGGLRIAMTVAGQPEYLEAVERIAVMREAAWDSEPIHAEAEHRLVELAALARDPLMIERFGAEYRRDTSPKMAELLGIDPPAIPRLEDVQQLLRGRRADGEPVPGKHEARTGTPIGSLDLLFSPDKSVSVTWRLASEEERRLIGRAHRDAVHHAMLGIAKQAGYARREQKGVVSREPADITWIAFRHKYSRSADPQLHSHVSVLNVSLGRETGLVRNLDTRLLHGYYDVAKERYHTHLAQGLRDLGLDVEMRMVGHGRGWQAAVVKGIEQNVIDHFSGRTAEAERAATKYLAERYEIDYTQLSGFDRSSWLTRSAAATRRPMYYVQSQGQTVHARAEGQGYVPPAHFLNPEMLKKAREVQQQVEQRRDEVTRPFAETKRQRMLMPHIEQNVHVQQAVQLGEGRGLER
jgi:conjugative relaxase-like TrwC/TraI family protein